MYSAGSGDMLNARYGNSRIRIDDPTMSSERGEKVLFAMNDNRIDRRVNAFSPPPAARLIYWSGSNFAAALIEVARRLSSHCIERREKMSSAETRYENLQSQEKKRKNGARFNNHISFIFLAMIMGSCTDVFNHRVQPLSTDIIINESFRSLQNWKWKRQILFFLLHNLPLPFQCCFSSFGAHQKEKIDEFAALRFPRLTLCVGESGWCSRHTQRIQFPRWA